MEQRTGSDVHSQLSMASQSMEDGDDALAGGGAPRVAEGEAAEAAMEDVLPSQQQVGFTPPRGLRQVRARPEPKPVPRACMRALRRQLRAGRQRPLACLPRCAVQDTVPLHAGAQVPVAGGGVDLDDLIADAPLEACSHGAADADGAMDADRAADAEGDVDPEGAKQPELSEAPEVPDAPLEADTGAGGAATKPHA